MAKRLWPFFLSGLTALAQPTLPIGPGSLTLLQEPAAFLQRHRNDLLLQSFDFLAGPTYTVTWTNEQAWPIVLQGDYNNVVVTNGRALARADINAQFLTMRSPALAVSYNTGIRLAALPTTTEPGSSPWWVKVNGLLFYHSAEHTNAFGQTWNSVIETNGRLWRCELRYLPGAVILRLGSESWTNAWTQGPPETVTWQLGVDNPSVPPTAQLEVEDLWVSSTLPSWAPFQVKGPPYRVHLAAANLFTVEPEEPDITIALDTFHPFNTHLLVYAPVSSDLTVHWDTTWPVALPEKVTNGWALLVRAQQFSERMAAWETCWLPDLRFDLDTLPGGLADWEIYDMPGGTFDFWTNRWPTNLTLEGNGYQTNKTALFYADRYMLSPDFVLPPGSNWTILLAFENRSWPGQRFEDELLSLTNTVRNMRYLPMGMENVQWPAGWPTNAATNLQCLATGARYGLNTTNIAASTTASYLRSPVVPGIPNSRYGALWFSNTTAPPTNRMVLEARGPTATNWGGATFTVGCWVKRLANGGTCSTGSGGASMEPIVTKGMAEAEEQVRDLNYFIGFYNSGTDWHFGCDLEPSPGSVNKFCYSTNVIVQNDTWYFVVQQWDGYTNRLYVNGALAAQYSTNTFQWGPSNSWSAACLGTAMTTNGTLSGWLNAQLCHVFFVPEVLPEPVLTRLWLAGVTNVFWTEPDFDNWPLADAFTRQAGEGDFPGLVLTYNSPNASYVSPFGGARPAYARMLALSWNDIYDTSTLLISTPTEDVTVPAWAMTNRWGWWVPVTNAPHVTVELQNISANSWIVFTNFTVWPTPASAERMAIIGDLEGGHHPQMWAATQQLLTNKLHPTRWLSVGDLRGDGENCADLWTGLKPWIPRLYPVAGNHDYDTVNGQALNDFLTYWNMAELGVTASPVTYFVDLANIRFVFWDMSSLYGVSGATATDLNKVWQGVAWRTVPFCVVMSHWPPDHSIAGTDAFPWSRLDRGSAGVHLHVAGHTHGVERLLVPDYDGSSRTSMVYVAGLSGVAVHSFNALHTHDRFRAGGSGGPGIFGTGTAYPTASGVLLLHDCGDSLVGEYWITNGWCPDRFLIRGGHIVNLLTLTNESGLVLPLYLGRRTVHLKQHTGLTLADNALQVVALAVSGEAVRLLSNEAEGDWRPASPFLYNSSIGLRLETGPVYVHALAVFNRALSWGEVRIAARTWRQRYAP